MKTRIGNSQSLLLKAARPYHWILAFLLAVPPPSLTYDSKPKRNYIFVYFIYAVYAFLLLNINLWMSYINRMTVDSIVSSFDLGDLTNVLASAQSNNMFFIQMLNQFVMWFYFKKLVRLFNDIELLEHDIRWNSLSQRIGVARTTSNLEKHFRQQLFCKSGCMLLFTGILNNVLSLAVVAPTIPIFYRILTCLSMVMLQMKNVEFCVTVQLVHELLQQLLEELLLIRKQLLATVDFKDRKYLYVALQHNQQCLSRIWSLVDQIGSYYSIPMISLFLYDALYITSLVNWSYLEKPAYGKFYNPREWRIMFTLCRLVSMMVPCWICQCCIQTYDRFASVLHNLGSNGSDTRLSMCLREYSLQIKHQTLVFSCNGYFDINLKNFGGNVLCIVTYVVIIIQFRQQAEAENERKEKLSAVLFHNITSVLRNIPK